MSETRIIDGVRVTRINDRQWRYAHGGLSRAELRGLRARFDEPDRETVAPAAELTHGSPESGDLADLLRRAAQLQPVDPAEAADQTAHPNPRVAQLERNRRDRQAALANNVVAGHMGALAPRRW